jgi:hypothetical protein
LCDELDRIISDLNKRIMDIKLNGNEMEIKDKNKIVVKEMKIVKIVKIVKENNIQNEKYCRLISGDINYII